MQAVSSNVERLYIRPDLYSRLESCYSDAIVKHQLLNRLVLSCNMLIAYLYRIVINAAMQSDSTLRARGFYQQFLDAHFQRAQLLQMKDSVLLGFDKQQLQITQFEHVESTLKTTARDSMRSSKRQQVRPTSLAPVPSQLYIPVRCRLVKLISAALLLAELMMLHRYVICYYVLLDSFPRETFITRSKAHEGFSSAIGEPIRLNYAKLLDPAQEGAQPVSRVCRAKFLDYLDENYNDFRLWNASAGIKEPRWAADLLPEQKTSFQVVVREVRISCYLLATFVATCGIAGRLVSEFVRYDIAPLLFVFDPKFIAFNVQLSLNYYLELMRSSYMNFWSTYQIAADGSLVTLNRDAVFSAIVGRTLGHRRRRADEEAEEEVDEDDDDDDDDDEFGEESSDETLSESDETLQETFHDPPETRTSSSGPSFSSSVGTIKEILSQRSRPKVSQSGGQSNVIDSICLNHQLFGDYMPTARSQAWRKFLSIWNPAAQFIFIALCTGGILMLWYIYLTKNSASTVANKELAAFLLDELQQGSSIGLLAIRNGCPGLPADGLISDFIAGRLLAGYLKTINQPVEALKDVDGVALVARLLQPHETPTPADWFVVSVGVAYTSVVSALYINAFLFTMSDLCFWLIELRMKLNICTSILQQGDLSSSLADSRLCDRKRWQRYSGIVRPGSPWGGRLASVRSGREEQETGDESSKRDRFASPASDQEDDEFAKRELQLTSDRHKSPADSNKINLSRQLFERQLHLVSDRRESERHKTLDSDGDDLCNLGMLEVMLYLVANHSKKRRICEEYAARVLGRDHQVDYSSSFRKTSEKFLTSTYLDFRLFQDSIDDCRNTMNFLISYTVLHALNILVSSTQVEDSAVRIGLIVAGFSIANFTLVGASFFQSQCSKLHSPIYSILAASVRCDKTVRHLSLLWRRLLTDMAGSRSRFSLRVYSLNVSYATALQFNLSVASLYILAVDKTKFG